MSPRINRGWLIVVSAVLLLACLGKLYLFSHSKATGITAGTIGTNTSATQTTTHSESNLGFALIAERDLSKEAQTVLKMIRQRAKFPYRQDGQIFGNREHNLPQQARGYYREYTVPTPDTDNRGARRIIAGEGTSGDVATGGEYYYTDNHYRSFSRVQTSK